MVTLFGIKEDLSEQDKLLAKELNRLASEKIQEEKETQIILGVKEKELKIELVKSFLSEIKTWKDIYKNPEIHKFHCNKEIAIRKVQISRLALKKLGLPHIEIPHFNP